MKTIRLSDLGLMPDTGHDATPLFRRALEQIASMSEPVTLEFQKGTYHFYRETACMERYHITNTASEAEAPDATKHIGLHLKGLRNLTLEGGGARLLFHGRMTMMVLDGCENVTVQNLEMDFARPTMSEMKVVSIGAGYIDCAVHPDSWYGFEDGRFYWRGEGFTYLRGPAQQYDAKAVRTWRCPNPVEQAVKIEETAPGMLRLFFGQMPETKPGNVYQMRDGIRDEVGIFLCECRNITLQDLALRYTHGLGIVGQFTENITVRRVLHCPDDASGRTAAAFADSLHLSGCKGDVLVEKCRFAGAHDDHINVHGTYLLVDEVPDDRHLLVTFMHGQSYGFRAFYPGDAILFAEGGTLREMGRAEVASAEPASPRQVRLTLKEPLERPVPPGAAVENLTWSPGVTIRGNHFSCTPTRGILVSVRGRVDIRDNAFNTTEMSALLVTGDAGSWFESGPVEDLTVEHNTFLSCGSPAICIWPETAPSPSAPAYHGTVRIRHNCFIESGWKGLVQAKSTAHLTFEDNRIFSSGRGATATWDEVVVHTQCTHVYTERNTIRDGSGMQPAELTDDDRPGILPPNIER